MKITRRQLNKIINEALGLHGGHGYMGFAYHNSKDPPEMMLPILTKGEFTWNPNSYSEMYVFVRDDEIPVQRAGKRKGKYHYGDYLYKLRVNYYGALIFHEQLAKDVYGENWHPADQVMLILGDKRLADITREVVNNSREINRIWVHRNQDASVWLREIAKSFKMVVNRFLIAYVNDPSIFVPVAWKENHGQWNKVDTESLKGNMSGIYSGFHGRENEIDFEKQKDATQRSYDFIDTAKERAASFEKQREEDRQRKNAKNRERRLIKRGGSPATPDANRNY